MSCSALFAIKRAIENFRAEIKAQTVFTLGKVQSWNLNDIIILSTLTRAITRRMLSIVGERELRLHSESHVLRCTVNDLC